MRDKILFAIMGTVILGLILFYSTLSDGRMHLSFLNIGQGDSMVARIPDGEVLVVDGGPTAATVQELAPEMGYFRTRIDTLVLTHSDWDHLTGLFEILERYEVGLLVLPAVSNSAADYQDFLSRVEKYHVPVHWAKRGEVLQFSTARLEILAPIVSEFNPDADRNAEGIVSRLCYGVTCAMLMGDVGQEGELRILASGVEVGSNLLKIGHHGGAGSTSMEWLEAVAPQFAVISVGKNNYGHPSEEALSRLQSAGVEVWRTDEGGTVRFASDGLHLEKM